MHSLHFIYFDLGGSQTRSGQAKIFTGVLVDWIHRRSNVYVIGTACAFAAQLQVR